MGAGCHLWAVIFICGQGSCPGCLSLVGGGSSSFMLLFVVMVAVIGAGLSFVSTVSSFVGGRACSWAAYIVCG